MIMEGTIAGKISVEEVTITAIVEGTTETVAEGITETGEETTETAEAAEETITTEILRNAINAIISKKFKSRNAALFYFYKVTQQPS